MRPAPSTRIFIGRKWAEILFGKPLRGSQATDSRFSALDRLALRALVQVAVAVAVEEVDDEARGQPEAEAYPVDDAEFRHQVAAGQEPEHRYQGEALHEAEHRQRGREDDEDPVGNLVAEGGERALALDGRRGARQVGEDLRPVQDDEA